MQHQPPVNRLASVAEDQWGLVTKRQAEDLAVRPSELTRLVALGSLERVAHGVYRLRGAPLPDHLDLRAAWLRLDPAQPAWKRIQEPDVAVVSHRSAASLYGVGDLPPDVHEFALPVRRQSRRPDVRLHRETLTDEDRIILHGLPTTRAGRMIGDLLGDYVEPGALGGITMEVLDRTLDYPEVVARHIAPYAHRFRLPRGDGWAMLDYLLAATGATELRNRMNRERSHAAVR